MGLLDQLLGRKSVEPVIATTPVNESWIVEGLSLAPIVSSVIDERQKGKDKILDYEHMYRIDGITFGFVNYLTKVIAGKGFYFVGSSKTLVKRLTTWCKRNGIKFKFEDMCKDAVIAGTAWVENVNDGSGGMYVKVLNPNNMDFIRDINGDVDLDDEDKPVGYVQEVHGQKRFWYKDRIEENGRVLFNSSESDDLREHIKTFKLVTFGDSYLGISMVKTSYRSAIIRTNISDMIGESSFRGGGIVAYVEGSPSPEVRKELRDDLKNITSRNVFIFNNKIKLDKIPVPDDISARHGLLYYYIDEQGASLNVPMECLVSGGKTYSQDMTAKLADFEGRILSLQERFAYQIMENMIKPLCAIWGIKDIGDTELVFVSSTPASQLTRARILATLGRRGLLKYDPEIEMYVRQELRLPHSFLDKELDIWKKGKKGYDNEEPSAEVDVRDDKGKKKVKKKGGDFSEPDDSAAGE